MNNPPPLQPQQQPNNGQYYPTYPNNPNYYNVNYGPPAMYPPRSGMPVNTELIKKVRKQEIEKAVPPKAGSHWGHFQYRPSSVTFATQNPDEKVYVLVRRHWLTNVSWVVKNFFYSLIPIIVFLLINFASSIRLFTFEFDFIGLRAYIIIILAYYSLIFSNIMINFFDWYFDPYIVTNDRVVDYNFVPFRNYTVKEADLENIEDVKEKSGGFFANLFDYGDVTITTAAKDGEQVFKSVPKPTKVRDIISDLSKIAKTFQYGN